MGFDASKTATVGLGLQASGVASGAIGSLYGAKAQQAALRGSADLQDINARMVHNTADQNSRIAELAAQTQLEAGQKAVQNSQLRTAALKSSQRASLAANGIDLGSDTATNILTTTDYMGERDAEQLNVNAVRSAWGYRTQATNIQTEAASRELGLTNDANIKRGSANNINPGTAAATSLLTGAGQVAGSWYQLNKSGALDEAKANVSADPILSIGRSRKWWSGN